MAAARTVNTTKITGTAAIHRAGSSPNSSPTTPNTRSVLAAPRCFSQPSCGPVPNSPPDAMADMVRLC